MRQKGRKTGGKAWLMLMLYAVVYSTLQAQPKREIRAAWITNVYGLDWPVTTATSPQRIDRQKEELIEILDRLKSANFNTVLFQTRARGDVFYNSAIEPYNAILTGEAGKSPGYDPLAFAVAECHKRGMECHAWMVTIPLGGRKHVAQLGKTSVVKRHPQICVAYKQEYFLNPGHPQTKEYLWSLVSEVVERYDIDGVHFDYLRYPEYASRFPDAAEFRKYGKGRTVGQWRRDNLTDIVRFIYQEIKKRKPWVKVSSSPVGKYDDTSRYSSRGWNAYHAVFQDVKVWLAEGIQDQIYPMMYFRGNSFYPFALDWKEHSNQRHIVPGLGIYFLHPDEGNWHIDEIDRQMYFLRSYGLDGASHYRVKYLMDNTQGVYDRLLEEHYRYPALQPVMSWIDSIAPAPPTRLKVARLADGYWKLTWQASTDNDPHNEPAYVVYASDRYPVDVTDPRNIISSYIKGTEYIYAPILPWMRCEYFAVTAVDRYGNESLPAEADLYGK